MDPCHLAPDGTQILSSDRDFHVHHLLDRLNIAQAVSEGADPAGSLGDIDILVEVASVYKFLKSAVNESDGRDDIDDLLILKDKVQMDRFRKDRMLRSERNNASLLCSFVHHFASFLAAFPASI